MEFHPLSSKILHILIFFRRTTFPICIITSHNFNFRVQHLLILHRWSFLSFSNLGSFIWTHTRASLWPLVPFSTVLSINVLSLDEYYKFPSKASTPITLSLEFITSLATFSMLPRSASTFKFWSIYEEGTI